ncbi:hypothetical protein [Solirubrobacter soli]|uniref:hypothetical protein n=1 Tax=Solirubrobacter soli TaxID=363832 RepID=UPI00040F7FD3|nr:hypothetical protein [Solirubrobacter soli]
MRFLLPAIVALLVLPAAAQARWEPVTDAGASNTDEVGLARTPDGRLHVAWRRQPDATSYELNHTIISPGGVVDGGGQLLAQGWAGIGSPTLVRTASGQLQLYAAAQRSIDAADPIQSLARWTSDDDGDSWELTPGDVATGAGFADPVGGAVGADGATPYVAWGTTYGLFVHRGADPSTPAANLQGADCCGYEPSLALSGSVLDAAWYSNASGREGVWAQAIDQATGAPSGSAMRMPGTADSVAPDQRIGLAATASGVFAAYPGGGPGARTLLVWRVGAGAKTVAKDVEGLRVPAISTTPDGRLWVTWTARGRVFARRSDRTDTRWGATTSIPVLPGTATVYKLAANAQAGVLDVLAGFEPTGGRGVQTFYSRLRPGLSLAARRAHGKVELTVTDAGDPVAGARVTLAGRHGVTDAAGTATITTRHSGRASATKAGYVRATSRVR